MQHINLTRILSKPKYFVLAIIAFIGMLFLYIYAQLLGLLVNFSAWLDGVSPLNGALIIIFAFLFGITLSFQAYYWFKPKACPVHKKIEGASTSSATMFSILFVAQCPSCASLGTLLLPLSALTFFVQYGWLINLISIALLLFTLNYLGAFSKKESCEQHHKK